ncbi:hypothetical protein Bca52824_052347 [Brassica carinata]|uniref:Uncharacterized protein n=1 Tax=Brassica carinata TaxID=52824 RepID=A0A8X7R4A4_BRACI|nr:hypothetical protein Bca52824_052347 [Brassica carinata]
MHVPIRLVTLEVASNLVHHYDLDLGAIGLDPVAPVLYWSVGESRQWSVCDLVSSLWCLGGFLFFSPVRIGIGVFLSGVVCSEQVVSCVSSFSLVFALVGFGYAWVFSEACFRIVYLVLGYSCSQDFRELVVVNRVVDLSIVVEAIACPVVLALVVLVVSGWVTRTLFGSWI